MSRRRRNFQNSMPPPNDGTVARLRAFHLEDAWEVQVGHELTVFVCRRCRATFAGLAIAADLTATCGNCGRRGEVA